IDAALRKVVILENGGSLSDNLTDTELELMWNNTFAGVGHQSDSISNLNAALSGIDFADFESRVRGQNAFAAGHEFCIQHLPACFYAGTNMIGVYRSVIARDCNAYERRLRAVLTLAENTVATLSR
ncbi:MAG: hypothetical protein FWE17_00680, partial [Alphaproteobacteria bacterium]|nr:hypothetical protein [Alphaproteobacteria bacterium]